MTTSLDRVHVERATLAKMGKISLFSLHGFHVSHVHPKLSKCVSCVMLNLFDFCSFQFDADGMTLGGALCLLLEVVPFSCSWKQSPFPREPFLVLGLLCPLYMVCRLTEEIGSLAYGLCTMRPLSFSRRGTCRLSSCGGLRA